MGSIQNNDDCRKLGLNYEQAISKKKSYWSIIASRFGRKRNVNLAINQQIYRFLSVQNSERNIMRNVIVIVSDNDVFEFSVK